MINFAMTPHRAAIDEVNQRAGNFDAIRYFIDLRNSIPVFFDEEKVSMLLKDTDSAILSFVDSTLNFIDYMIKFTPKDKKVEFHFFYETGRSEYHKRLNKNYKANRQGSYVILNADEVKQAKDLNNICFRVLDLMLKSAPNIIRVYNLKHFEADFIPHYIINDEEFKTDVNYLNVILSNDKDMYQTLTKDKSVILLKKDFRNRLTKVITYSNMYLELTKLDFISTKNLIPDILAVAGDESDGVEGVKGIGYKSIATLLKIIDMSVNDIFNKSIDELTEKFPDIKGRVKTTAKKIIENQKLIENNFKQVDYNIIQQNIPLKTKNEIRETFNKTDSNYEEFLKDLKEIRSDHSSLLVYLFPDKIDQSVNEYTKKITSDGIYKENPVEGQKQKMMDISEYAQINNINVLPNGIF